MDFDRVDLVSAQSFPASDPPPWTLGTETRDYRIERDSMGEVAVPREALYGAQTQRAKDNFPVTGHRPQAELIRALGLIKSCAARANGELGTLAPELAKSIESAAETIAAGIHFEHFVVGLFQSGSGTSTNMNANEIIGHLADAHPNDHVNRSQSSNDVFPSAIHVACALMIRDALLPSLESLRVALEKKAQEFWDVVKIGRTHLQDATPIRLGQEFSGYAHQLRAGSERIMQALDGMYELPLGGTAVGTGINAPTGFAPRVMELLATRTRLPLREARNHFEAQAARDAALFLSGALKTCAVTLTKIGNDIRWLGSGPRAGIGELRLPALQPGSSIMPGKVNPVAPESLLMICAQVVGYDAAITWACASGNFELNTMMPLIAYDLLDSIRLLSAGAENFRSRCVEGLEARGEGLRNLVERSLAMATALAPEIGYDKASAIATEAFETGRTVREVALEKSGLSPERIAELLAFK